MAKHTPGPWRAEIGHDGPEWNILTDKECRDDEWEVATAWPHHGAEANAKLIAAAPKMLEALQEVVSMRFPIDLDVLSNVKEAIKAATAESS